ncbi:MAG TPA: protein kinase [Candidatus Eisenbacteria bacterium]|nr:protein kinase [Candidatus Eisenbacteria bacterium]
MTPDTPANRDEALRRLADAVGDRTPVDWQAAFEAIPEESHDELRALKALERLTRAHEMVAEEFEGGPAAMLEGTTIAHYRVIEKLGEGGMGVVYRARDDRLGRDIALKVLHPDRFGDDSMRRGLLREARLAGSLNDPNIATVYDVGESDRYVYIAIECVDGATLHDLAQGRALPTSTAIEYGIQIASALRAAHAAGIVHRDLKSRNICVSRSGLVKVLDFGIAASTGRAGSADARGAHDADDSASPAAGTLAYMAPELLRGEPADARSDIWSLGVCLYEMLAGARPFVGAGAREIERAILHADPPDLPASVGLPLRNVVARCLHKEPERRYGSAAEVLSALKALHDLGPGELAPSPEPVPPAPKPSRLWWAWTALAIAALVIVYVALMGRPSRGPAILVLPARNESGEDDQQYLADGLTDQIINSFAGLSRIQVLSRTTSDAVARAPQPLPSAARRYGFNYALETAVVRAGGRLRVHARLVDARSDRSVWVESYERDVGQIVTVDNEIVLGVARRLKTPLTSSETARLGAARSVEPAAFQAFVRGRAAVMERRYGAALELFREAVRADSTYASAYAGLADGYTEAFYYGQLDRSEAIARAAAAADRALSLDSTQADAHLAKAFVFGVQWDWARAVEQLRNAEADAPGSAQVHYRWSFYDGLTNRGVEAVEEMKRAVQLDPASPRMASELGLAYMNARQIESAEQEFERVIAWDDGIERRRARAYHARCLALTGRAGKAVAEMTASGEAAMEVFELEELAYLYAAAGRDAESRRIVEGLLALPPGAASPLAVAAAQLASGSRDAALATLQGACEQRDPRILWLGVDQRFDPIRSEPRYRAIVAAMGLEKAPRG